MCNKKTCTTNNFPLKIISTNSKIVTVDFNQELTQKFLKKLDLPALTQATKDLQIYKFDFEKLNEEEINNMEILKYIHHLINEVQIVEGKLICNNCNREYIIHNGIPNLVLNDNEV
jgi:multifunctional methyltransferase subunit TRM112